MEIFQFALFIKERFQVADGQAQKRVKAVPARKLSALTGIVAWGGDALEETERLSY